MNVENRIVHQESGMYIEDACLASMGADFSGQELLEATHLGYLFPGLDGRLLEAEVLTSVCSVAPKVPPRRSEGRRNGRGGARLAALVRRPKQMKKKVLRT